MYAAATELYNKRFEKYYHKCEKLSYAKKNKLDKRFKPLELKLEDHDCNGFFTEEESDDKTLEGDKKDNLLIYQPCQHQKAIKNKKEKKEKKPRYYFQTSY